MTVREYIGARYVPLMMGDWDNTKTYEPLSIVLYQGNSYTSTQYVPTGIEITNEQYWAETGNYNAQVEAYRQEVLAISEQIETIGEGTIEKLEDKTVLENSIVMAANYAPWKLVEVWNSYMSHIDKFYYGAHSILETDYDESTDTFTPATITGRYNNSAATFGISCTTSILLALMGVYYENCRIVNGTITPGDNPVLSGGYNYCSQGGKSIDLNYPVIWNDYSQENDHMTYASQLAKLLNDAGYLHKRNDFSSGSEFAPGDILFRCNQNDEERYWKNIGHTSIYLGPWSTGALIAETGSDSVIFAIRQESFENAFSDVKYFARIPVAGNAVVKNLIEVNAKKSGFNLPYVYSSQTSPGVRHIIRFDQIEERYPLIKTNNVYTLLIKASNITPDANVRCSICWSYYDGNDTEVSTNCGNLNFANKATYIGNGWYYCVVNTLADRIASLTNGINGITIQPYADDTFDLTIEDVKLYDRLILPSPEYLYESTE